jgi:hypothetical protein
MLYFIKTCIKFRFIHRFKNSSRSLLQTFKILSPTLTRDIFLTQKLYERLFSMKMIDISENYIKNATNLS